jgi:hypothetical protein
MAGLHNIASVAASLTVCRENAANLGNFQMALAPDSILGRTVMTIHRLLENHAFEPEAIMTMTAAYEDVLRTLCLAHRSDPITWIVAKKVIQFAQRGERDPVRLRELALESLSSA